METEKNKGTEGKKQQARISVDEITHIFSDIDKEILSLHECSTNDFLGLNENFKRFHKDALIIQNNAHKIFNQFAEGEELANGITNFENFYESSTNYFKTIISYIDALQKTLGDIFNALELMYIPTHNYNQNLMTLKVLLTKLNLNLSHTSQPLTSDIKIRLKALFKDIKEDYVSFQQQVNMRKESVSYSKNRLSTIRKNMVPVFSTIQENIKKSKNILEHKTKEAGEAYPEIETLNQSNTQNIANIITNLQYHDIIRQKIEHVQKVHKEILEDMNKLDSKADKESKKNGLLIKVKDIAGIQSSQMLHANKEYQKAIHIITSKMIELGNNMNNMAQNGEKFVGNNGTSDDNQFNQIKNHLNEFNQTYPNNQETIKEILFLKKNLSDDCKTLVTQYKKLHRGTDQIIKFVLSFTHKKEQEQGGEESNIESQIVALMYDIATNKDQLTNLLKSLNDSTEKLAQAFHKPEDDLDTFHTLYEKNNMLLAGLEESINDILIYVNLNNSLSSDNEKAIQMAVSKIQYYDFFERTAKVIIEKLKEIHLALKAEEEGLDEQHIRHLKEQYTMKSEHMIHEQVLLGNTDDIDLFDNDENNEDDDNLELF